MKNEKKAPGAGQKNGEFFGEYHKDIKISDTNKNFLSVLQNLEDCEMSGIGHVFENKDLRLKTPDNIAKAEACHPEEWRLKVPDNSPKTRMASWKS